MFNRLLIPLDGSELAESVLPAAVYFAKTLGSSVMLLHVVERNAPALVHRERHLRAPAEAVAYLDKVKAWLQVQGVRPSASGLHVHEETVGDVPRGIAAHAHELSADLVMMCTHGGADLHRLLWGAVAQQVAAIDSTPVFLMPQRRNPEAGYSCADIMLPLDGKAEHESGIGVALFLAEKFHASVHPFMVVPHQDEVADKWIPVSRLLPSATQALLDLSAEHGAGYLDVVRNRFAQKGIAADPKIVRGEPNRELLKAVRKLDPDLVILGTHGRSGLSAFFEGSVTSKLCEKAKTPLLLVPAEKTE
jgi:nucleotide-binding universal stress UspA family protein